MGGDGFVASSAGAHPSGVGVSALSSVQHDALLATVSDLLGTALEIESALHSIARLAVPDLADGCAIDLLMPDGTVVPVAVADVESARVAQVRALRQRYPLDPAYPLGAFEAMRSGDPSVVPEATDAQIRAVSRDTAHLDLLRALAVRAWLSVPLLVGHRVLGALTLIAAESGRTFGDDELARAQEVARRIAVAVEHARLYREAQEARMRAERLHAVTAALAQALTPEAVARVIIEDGLTAFATDAGSIFALVEEGKIFELLGYTGYAHEDAPRFARVPADREGPLADAVWARELVVVESPTELVARWPHLAADLMQSGDAATVAVPLLVDGRVLGVLYAAFRHPRRFSPDDRAFLMTLGGQCAQALERARLYTSVQEESARQRLLAEAGAALASSLEEAAILTTMTQLIVPALADWCTIYTLTTEGGLMRVALAHTDPVLDDLMHQRFADPVDSLLNRLVTHVTGTGQAELNATLPPIDAVAPLDPEQGRRAALLQSASSILVPLTTRGRTIGALGLFRATASRRYQQGDLWLAEELGRRAALAMDNARLYREAQEAVALRDQFLTAAAHELKTPLTVLLGNAELVLRRTARDGVWTAWDTQALQVVVAQAQEQRALVEVLLDLSRLDAGRLLLERAAVDLGALAQRVVTELRPRLESHTLTCVTPVEAMIVEGDGPRLEGVVRQLLANAFAYSPQGGEVIVQVARQGAMAVLVVIDQGMGIPQEAHAHLFTRFYRAPNVDTDHISGLGIGLYLSHEVVTRHGGTLEVESTEGQGSTFRVCLPLAAAAPSDGVRDNRDGRGE